MTEVGGKRIWTSGGIPSLELQSTLNVLLTFSNVETSFLVCAAELSKPSSAPPDSVLDTQQTEGPPNVRGFGEPSVDSSLSGVRPGLQNVASFAVRTRDPILPMQYIEEGSSSGPGPGPSSSALRHRASWVADGHWDSSSLRDDMHQEPTQSSFRVPSQPERVRRRVRASEAEDSSSAGEEMEAEQSRTSKKFRTGMQRNLYGSLHVSAVRVIDPDGVMGLWFLFTVGPCLARVTTAEFCADQYRICRFALRERKFAQHFISWFYVVLQADRFQVLSTLPNIRPVHRVQRYASRS